MAHLIDKDTLVAEIRKRFDEYSNSILKHYDACKEAKAQELGKILTILDTFEVKEVDLEKYYRSDDTPDTAGYDLTEDVQEMIENKGLRWHPMSDPMLPWHTCLLVHEKSYCIVRRHDDGRMFEITNNIEVKDGDPFHLIKWIDLGDIAKR